RFQLTGCGGPADTSLPPIGSSLKSSRSSRSASSGSTSSLWPGVCSLIVSPSRSVSEHRRVGGFAAAGGGCQGAVLLSGRGCAVCGVAVEGASGCAVDVVAGAGGVVADLLRHEFGSVDRLSVALVRVVVAVALGDELVALDEPLVGALCCRPIEDEVADR